MIEDESGAAKLAKAILSDLELYNAEQLRGASDVRGALKDQVAEGRSLFEARASPALQPVFERELQIWLSRVESAHLSAAGSAPNPGSAPLPGSIGMTGAPSSGKWMVIAIALVIATLGAGIYFMTNGK